jgi:hypothetical protein
MNIKIYDNKIIAPVKHGTRYLDKVFGDCVHYSENAFFKEIEFSSHRKWRGIDMYILYRHPYEHLVSALHTEILNKDVSNFTIENIISQFISSTGAIHWTPHLLERTYTSWCHSNKHKVHLVHLSELSKLLNDLGYKNLPTYDYNDYQFKDVFKTNWISKDDIVDLVVNTFPDEWDEMVKLIEQEMLYYNKIQNNERDEMSKFL